MALWRAVQTYIRTEEGLQGATSAATRPKEIRAKRSGNSARIAMPAADCSASFLLEDGSSLWHSACKNGEDKVDANICADLRGAVNEVHAG